MNFAPEINLRRGPKSLIFCSFGITKSACQRLRCSLFLFFLISVSMWSLHHSPGSPKLTQNSLEGTKGIAVQQFIWGASIRMLAVTWRACSAPEDYGMTTTINDHNRSGGRKQLDPPEVAFCNRAAAHLSSGRNCGLSDGKCCSEK